MGATKASLFSKEQNDIAGIMKALGHPARIAILQYIVRTNTCICGDLVEELGLAQPTISQHLKELKNVTLIEGTIEGNNVCYCINQETWESVKKFMNAFFVPVKLDKKCC